MPRVAVRRNYYVQRSVKLPKNELSVHCLCPGAADQKRASLTRTPAAAATTWPAWRRAGALDGVVLEGVVGGAPVAGGVPAAGGVPELESATVMASFMPLAQWVPTVQM
jgi:hypothetical protein